MPLLFPLFVQRDLRRSHSACQQQPHPKGHPAAVSMAALYALILYVFCLPAVVEEFAATGRWLLAATIAMGVALFFVYDVLLGRLMARWPAKV